MKLIYYNNSRLIKDVIKIEKEKIELALYVIDLKKAELIKKNNEKSFESYKEKISMLTKEKEQIYKQNEEVIEKVLSKYLKEVNDRRPTMKSQ